MKRIFWIIFLTGVVIYLAMVLWSFPVISKASGGLIPFDLRPGGYSYDAAQTFLIAITPEGRAQYLGPQRVLDLMYPAFLGLSFIMAFVILLPRKIAILASCFAIAGSVFDWIENALVAKMLLEDPQTLQSTRVAFASMMTVSKFAAVTASMCIFLAAVGWSSWRRFKKEGL